MLVGVTGSGVTGAHCWWCTMVALGITIARNSVADIITTFHIAIVNRCILCYVCLFIYCLNVNRQYYTGIFHDNTVHIYSFYGICTCL